MTAARTTKLVAFVLVAFVAVLFTVQNLGRVANLSLDLGFLAGQLATPQPVPYLVWVSFGLGLFVGVSWGLSQLKDSAKRIRTLEQNLARSSVQKDGDDWS